MLNPQQIQAAHTVIASLERDEVVRQLQTCPARFPIDFTPEWLDRQSLVELRHILAAVCQQCGHIPEAPGPPGHRVPDESASTATVAA